MTDTKATPATDEDVERLQRRIRLSEMDGYSYEIGPVGPTPGKGLSTVLRRLLARIAADAEIIKAREAAYESAQEGLKSARKQESEMRETIRNHESQARDARVYIASLEAERVALRAQVETLRGALG